jgi:hypothetical protein
MAKKSKSIEKNLPSVEGPQVSVDDARKMLLQEQNAKIEACAREVDAVLRKHGCSLDVSMTVSARGSQPNIRIIPQPPSVTRQE